MDISPNNGNNMVFSNKNLNENNHFAYLNTIKKQIHFNSPNYNFNLKNKLGNIDDKENNENEQYRKEDMNNIRMNLNENKLFSINNTTGNYDNISNNNNIFNEFQEEKINQNVSFFNNINQNNSNNKRSILKISNPNYCKNIINGNTNNPNKENNINQINKKHITIDSNSINNKKEDAVDQKHKKRGLNNSEISNFRNTNISNKSINFNITPDNKKNKSLICNENKNIDGLLNGYSFSELQYMDKENIPPIPKESSRVSNKITNNLIEEENELKKSPLEINIELGVSHLNSDITCRNILEIPITIDTKFTDLNNEYKINFLNDNNIKNNIYDIPLSKEFLIIFNTLNLEYNQIFEFLRIASNKINKEDKLYSNIFSNDRWLKKDEIEYLLNLEDKSPYFQNISYLNTEGILEAINYCVDISLENNSNIFSVIIVNELKDNLKFNGENVNEEFLKITKKLNEKRIFMVKNFSINTIILNQKNSQELFYNEKKGINEVENEKNNFINFFNELSNLTMGLNLFARVIVFNINIYFKILF